MKAVSIINHTGVEGLEIREIDHHPPPTADRVRVRTHAAGLNRADLLQLRGRYPAPPGYPQDIPGLEFAGEVEALGPEVRSWKVGQRVFGITAGGAQAEYIVVPENHLAAIPQNLGWAEAGAVPEVFITAHDAINTQAKLKLGETLLVHAAGSGVGTAAIQLARAAGARVFGTSRTAEKLNRSRALGLNEAIVIAEDPKVVVEAVSGWTSGRGVDVVLDLVGARYLEANLAALARKGRMMLVGTTSGANAGFDFNVVMSKRLTIRGTVLRGRNNEEKAAAVQLFANQVVPLLERSEVKPVIDTVYKVEDVRKAYARLESNEGFGKIVLLFE